MTRQVGSEMYCTTYHYLHVQCLSVLIITLAAKRRRKGMVIILCVCLSVLIITLAANRRRKGMVIILFVCLSVCLC